MWILYVQHPFYKKNINFVNLYESKTLKECVRAANQLPPSFPCYIYQVYSGKLYDREGHLKSIK